MRLLDRLERTGKLAKTIVYSLNPRDNDMIPSILGASRTEQSRERCRWAPPGGSRHEGRHDQADRALSSVGVLSGFVGMLTDSRSLLSYPRHEYFRRILCNIIGGDVERGEIPEDYALLGGMVRDICWNNAKEYFRLHSA